MAAGRSTPRTMVASMRMATGSPAPIILYSMAVRTAKTLKAAVMMTAALVTTPALPAMPPMIASRTSARP
jgi:hypothetical protein